MVIVVECESCHSRFRLKKTLLGGAFAIRFRCRACSGYIVVRNPEMRKIASVPPPTPPPASDPQLIPAAPATDPEPEMPAMVSEPASPAPDGPRAVPLEDLVPCSPEEEVRAERGIITGSGAVRRVPRASRSTTFNRSAGAMGILSFFAGVGIFLLVSGAYFFRDSNPGGRSPGRESSLAGSSSAAHAVSKPLYDVQDLESYIPRDALAGNLFVITGTVKNVGKVPSSGIHVRATLFGKDNQVLMEQESIAGNYIDKFSLPHMMRVTIERYLAAVRHEEGSVNRGIPPGSSLPFTVVYFDPPGKVETFKVLATDAEL